MKNKMNIIILIGVLALLLSCGLIFIKKHERNNSIDAVGTGTFTYGPLSLEYPVFYGWTTTQSESEIIYTPMNSEIYRPYKVSVEDIAVKVGPAFWNDAGVNPQGIKYKHWGTEDYYEQTIVWGGGKQYLISMPEGWLSETKLKAPILDSVRIWSAYEQKAINIADKELFKHYPERKRSSVTTYEVESITEQENMFTVIYSPRNIDNPELRYTDSDIRIVVDIKSEAVLDYEQHTE